MLILEYQAVKDFFSFFYADDKGFVVACKNPVIDRIS